MKALEPRFKPETGIFNRVYDSLCIVRKRAKKDALEINAQTAQRIHAHIPAAKHADDFDRPLFRALRHNGQHRSAPR